VRNNPRPRGTTRDYEEQPETARNNPRPRGTTRDCEEQPETARNNPRPRGITRDREEQPETARNNPRPRGTTRDREEQPETARNNPRLPAGQRKGSEPSRAPPAAGRGQRPHGSYVLLQGSIVTRTSYLFTERWKKIYIPPPGRGRGWGPSASLCKRAFKEP